MTAQAAHRCLLYID